MAEPNNPLTGTATGAPDGNAANLKAQAITQVLAVAIMCISAKLASVQIV